MPRTVTSLTESLTRGFERSRRQLVSFLDDRGWRERSHAVYARFSPSYEVRRDGLDQRLLQSVLAAVLGPDDLAVDIGANRGDVSRLLFQYAPGGAHVLVEPIAHLAAYLRARFPLGEVHEVALAADQGVRSFVYVRERPTRSGFAPANLKAGLTTERVEVRTTTLDGLLAGRRPRLVKIDVEGAELETLEGAAATLSAARPLVVFEHRYGAAMRTDETVALSRLLAASGLRVFDLDGRGPLDERQLLDTCCRGRIWNFLAHP